jgi:hypothetical protein
MISLIPVCTNSVHSLSFLMATLFTFIIYAGISFSDRKSTETKLVDAMNFFHVGNT